MTSQRDLMTDEARSRRRYEEQDAITREGKTAQSFKVGVITPGDTDWCFNGMRYRTPGIAAEAADSLAWRWTAVVATIVLPSADQVNTDDNGDPLPSA